MKNNPGKKLHISMAYKFGKEFTYKEFDFLQSMKMDDFISKKDLEVHFWNCNSKKSRRLENDILILRIN